MENAADSDDEELAEVQVTGTRILAPNVTAANPITSITAEDMQRLGIVNVGDALTSLVPQNISTYMPTNTGDTDGNPNRGSYFVGNTIANLRGLDPAFGSRTLTMVDGRRVVSTSNQADVVDLNIIPSNLLERMDVVTGGASATYGSGAMAGVVNLVLNRRLNGVNLDMDFGVNEAGDGASPHMALSGGTTLFQGKGHLLVGIEWQNQQGIRDCAAARDWCAESRTLFTNGTNLGQNPAATFTPLPGFDTQPAHFEQTNVRYSQFQPNGSIYYGNIAFTSGYRFTDDGTGIDEFPLGFRGGNGITTTTVNGDGPLTTTGTPLTPSNERRSLFTNFEFDFTPTTTAYVQASYANIDALNRNRYTSSTECVRFDTQGVALVQGASSNDGDFMVFGPNPVLAAGAAPTNTVFDPVSGANITTDPVWFNLRTPNWTVPSWRTWVNPGLVAPGGFISPYWVIPGSVGSGTSGTITAPDANTPPTIAFANARGTWRLVRHSNNNFYWLLVGIRIQSTDGSGGFYDPGTPAVLPQMGRNAYAFLYQLSPEARSQVQRSFGLATVGYGGIPNPDPNFGGAPLAGANTTAGSGGGASQLWGTNPCIGFTAVKKVWTPQIQQYTRQESETWRTVAGVRGRFGSDWRWEGYYQYGATDSQSKQNNVSTYLSKGMALDAVIDDRQTVVCVNGEPGGCTDGEIVSNLPVNGGTYGQPICRVTRDGLPILDSVGRPLSDPEGLAALAADCKPLNIFGTSFPAFTADAYGTTMTAQQAADLQRQALNYAFKDTLSKGANSLHTASFTTSGTLWNGWAGPLTGAFGIELRQDETDNKGTQGPYYLRGDIANGYADAFGGRTRVAEGYAEFNLPLASGLDGVDRLSIDAAIRYGIYNNKGGAGTTGESATQKTPNWKFQAEFAPFSWGRLRMTRSRDLRTAGYRELFLNQPGLPDGSVVTNPWRERTPDSNENQNERVGTIQVGNAGLRPEKSSTLTLGMVLSPGGFAQGMRVSIDYYNIRVRDGIAVQFAQGSPITACYTSNNTPAQYVNGELVEGTGTTNFDPDNESCQAINFGTNEDGTRNLQDILSYNTGKPTNTLPYQRRGVDLSWNYNFPLGRFLDGVPGSMAFTVRGTRALEASGTANVCATFNTAFQCTANGVARYDLVGQVRSSTFIPGVAATPKWSGNFSTSYLYGNLTTTVSARYTGGANLDNTWCDNADCPNYRNAEGRFLVGSVDNNRIKPYFNFSLNGSYNLGISGLRQFQVFGSINNLFDKSPPFTGGGISGATPQYNDTLGRAYRMGVRLRF